jgi:hypothetical protein
VPELARQRGDTAHEGTGDAENMEFQGSDILKRSPHSVSERLPHGTHSPAPRSRGEGKG